MNFKSNYPYSIAAKLAQQNLVVTNVSPITEEADGSIDLGERLHLQIGADYITLCHEQGEGLEFHDIPDEQVLIEQLQFHTQTFAIIKPGADCEAVLSELARRGFKIIGKPATKKLTEAEAALFYAEHADKPFYADLVSFMTSRPVTLLVLTYTHDPEQTVLALRKAVGATNSTTPGSIRAMFGNPAITRENAIHASDSKKAAARERTIFKL